MLFVKEAPLWKRFVSYFIDLAIVIFIVIIPFRSILNKFAAMAPGNTFIEVYNYMQSNQQFLAELNPLATTISIIVAISLLFYFTILEYNLGQTIGESVVNLHVKSKQKSLSSFMLRNITPSLILTSLSIIYVFDLIYLIVHKTRLTERWSRTWLED